MSNLATLKPAALRFSFQLAGSPFAPESDLWQRLAVTGQRPDGVTVTKTTYRHSSANLLVEEECLTFPDSAAVEWVLYFRNEGLRDTPVISDIQPLDIAIAQTEAAVTTSRFDMNANPIKTNFILHFMRGGMASDEDYRPYREFLGANGKASMTLAASGGRSSNQYLPFFNLQCGERAGVMGAIGWSGQWCAGFDILKAHTLRLCAGMEKTSLILHPGETIRTPRIVLLPWEGDCLDGHNQWRRFLAQHHTLPLLGQKPLPQTWIDTFFTYNSGFDVSTSNQKESMTGAARMGVESLVADAGWYECVKNWFDGVGSWVPRQATFPDGIEPLVEHGRKEDIGFGLWFEPERVHRGTRLWHEHPEWCLAWPDSDHARDWMADDNRLLNLGLPEVQDWLLEMLEGYISQGLAWFRHDFNMDPLPCWRAADAPDRQGMTEIRYQEGLYRVYDELQGI